MQNINFIYIHIIKERKEEIIFIQQKGRAREKRIGQNNKAQK